MHKDGLIALFVATIAVGAGGLWWYRTVPHDLALGTVEVGQISDYADLGWTYRPKHGSYVARIAFTSSDDLRATTAADRTRGGGYGFLLTATHCGCDEENIRDHRGACDISEFDLYDAHGPVNPYAPRGGNYTSSNVPADQPTTYHTYVTMTPWIDTEGPFDLIHKPVDVCLTLTRYGPLQPSAVSNVVRVPAAAFSAAVARAHLP